MKYPIFLSVSDVIHMHRLQIEIFGGAHGVRDIGLLESAIYAPQATFAGEFLYADVVQMGVAYMYHLIKNHPFTDGNKRIGMLVGLVFLRTNGVKCSLDNEQVYIIGMGIAESKLSQDVVVEMVRHSIDLTLRKI